MVVVLAHSFIVLAFCLALAFISPWEHHPGFPGFWRLLPKFDTAQLLGVLERVKLLDDPNLFLRQ